MGAILVATVNESAGNTLVDCMADTHHIRVTAPDHASVLADLKRRPTETLFIDVDILMALEDIINEKTAKTAISRLQAVQPSLEIVAMSTADRIRQAVAAVKAGARTYLTYPIALEEVELVMACIDDAQQMEMELDYLRQDSWDTNDQDVVHSNNAAMQDVFKSLRSVARTKATILLNGETGVGKGVLARLVHRYSERADKPFVTVHCGAIPDSLIESELFGHEKGAFTGADRKRLGKFEIANGGTIFLDEIGTISPAMQIKLLEFIQDRAFFRLGGEERLETNIRIIAAGNDDLNRRRLEGSFRSDLYYRLNVFPVNIPSLRERFEDIPLLQDAFVRIFSTKYGKAISSVHPHVTRALVYYNWPGNIRELENLIERACILETTSVLQPSRFPAEIMSAPPDHDQPSERRSFAQAKQDAIYRMEQDYITAILSRSSGRLNEAAKSAGISVRQLHNLMIKHQLKKETFRRSEKRP